MDIYERMRWTLKNDLRPRPAWACMKRRLLEFLGAWLVAIGGVFLIPITLILLLMEPLMILIRPMFYAVAKPKAVEKLIADMSKEQCPDGAPR